MEDTPKTLECCKVSVVKTNPPMMSYIVWIPPVYHRTCRAKPLQVILRHKGRTWHGIVPYSRWNRRASLHIRCDENGVPMEFKKGKEGNTVRMLANGMFTEQK